PQAVFDTEMKQILSTWFRFFLTYDPKTALRKVTCPVLAINGEKDLQVPPRENLAAIEGALKEAGNTDFTLKELPGLNHIFQKADKGLITEYGQIEETINPVALKTIGDWILVHVT
ncbi:MAG: alpha/beta hydrolase, partial [Candidatus Aminicenantes bacterium]|nr:alpha/beta hydrolase [Candidatus Aminicenantes bacterium]